MFWPSNGKSVNKYLKKVNEDRLEVGGRAPALHVEGTRLKPWYFMIEELLSETLECAVTYIDELVSGTFFI